MRITAIILAAGKGTRMKSPLPKVLHPVAGKSMLERVVSSAKDAGCSEVRIVVGHGQGLVKQVMESHGVSFFEQKEQKGTAHAVLAAQPGTIDPEDTVIILNGDHPLIFSEDIKNFVKLFKEERCDLALVTAKLKNPRDFGRIIRQNNQLVAVVEAKDASKETLAINEVNTGIYICTGKLLADYLPKIKNENSKQEFYLTDLISLAIEGKKRVRTVCAPATVAHGVNDQAALAKATQFIFRKKTKELMSDGVIIIDPKSTYIEQSVVVGSGSVIYPNVFLRGNTRVGQFTVVESNCFISDSQIAHSVQIKAGSYIEKSVIESKVSLGPYARIRPETHLMEDSHVGNFVEMKKVKFGKGSKAGHLTYLGDAEVGSNVNVGCGTITCNYATDKKKYKTKIGNDVFIGSDTQFVAPVEIGDHAVIGSGSTITKNVPANALAVARGKQFIKENYVNPNSSQADSSTDMAGTATAGNVKKD